MKYFGNTPQDPQDAAKEDREGPGISREQAEDWFEGKVIQMPAAPKGVNDGGPAFPFVEPDSYCSITTGVSTLDWFAAQALAGMLASDTKQQIPAAQLASWAYLQADAMLAEKERRAK